jgi:hypothetical protein
MEEGDKEKSKEEINITYTKATKQIKTNKSMQKVEARRTKRIEKQIIIDSAATSNFISDKLDYLKQEH